MSISQSHIIPAAPATTRGQPLHFSSWEKRKTDEKYVVYGNGLHTYCRDVANPSLVKTVHRNKAAVTATRVSPSGSYCATGDQNGAMVIWALDNEQNTVKLEQQVVGGRITDIAWTGDSERIIVVGEAKESFGAALMLAGSSCGKVEGHTRNCQSADIRRERPFRAASAGEDMTVVFHEGPPFKFKSETKHTNTANCVRFSPDGEHILSVGSDKAMFLYEAKTGERKDDIAGGAHTGSIYSVAWHPKSKNFITSSADKSVKLWDIDTKSVVESYKLENNTVDYMQMGCTYVGETAVSVGLNGDVNVFQLGQETPAKVLRGHQKPISALCVAGDKVVSASSDSAMFVWSDKTKSPADSLRVTAKKLHGSTVSAVAVHKDVLYSCALDDTVGATSLSTGEFKFFDNKVAGAPNSMVVVGDNLVLGTSKGLVVLGTDGTEKLKVATDYTPTCLATNGSVVAVGSREKKVTLYKVAGDKLEKGTELAGEHKAIITTVAISSDSKLAVGDQSREISMWQLDGADAKLLSGVGCMCFHTSGIKALAFSPKGTHLVSGATDSHIIVWDAVANTKLAKQELAHLGGVTALEWIADDEFLSAGQDCCLRTFKFAA